MPIELEVDLPHPVALRQILPKAAALLADMLGLATPAALTLDTLEDGRREPATTDELHEESPFFLVSIAGEPETVGVLAGSEAAYLSMASCRTPLEFVLGAALAIAFARELGGVIGDGWGFYAKSREAAPEELLQHLRVEGSANSYREASERLTAQLGWGLEV